MNDLVLTHFDEIIDQHAVGHTFIYNEFDEYYPMYFWGIDCFGYSRSSAYILNKIGF
jgi:hypothetical protein